MSDLNLIDFYNHLRATGLLDDLVDDIVAKVRETPPSREEARLRLTCAALTGVIALEGSHRADLNAQRAVENADACLALLYPEAPPMPNLPDALAPPADGKGGE